MNINTTSSAATASSSDISSAENSDDPNIKQLASNSLTRILNGVLGTIPGSDRSGGGATAQVDEYGAASLGDTDIIPDGQHNASTEGAYSAGLYSAYAKGGVWASPVLGGPPENGTEEITNQTPTSQPGVGNALEVVTKQKPSSIAELANLKEIAQPQLQHPEDLTQSLDYARQLTTGKTIQDLIGTSPTAQQQGDMQDALELLGVSNRQIAAYTASAYRLGADSYLNNLSGENRDTSYKEALQALQGAGRIRAAIDAGGLDAMKNYLYQGKGVESDLPDSLSAVGMIGAVEQGVKDSGNYSWTSLREPKQIARELILGGGAEYGSTLAMFPGVSFTSFAKRVQEGQDLLATTKIAAKVPESALEQDPVTLQPTTPADIAQTAFTMGSTVQDVYAALTAEGVQDQDALQAIRGAYDAMGVSDSQLSQLAVNAQDDIAAIGGAGNLTAYFNDPATAGQHTDLDELLAGMEARYEFDAYTQAPGSNYTFSASGSGFGSARQAVSDVLGSDAASLVPVGLVEAEPGAEPGDAPTEGFVGNDELRRNLASTGSNQTASAATNTTGSNQTASSATNTTASNQTASSATNATGSNQTASSATNATASNQTASAAQNATGFNVTGIAAHNASGLQAGQANGTLNLPPAQNVTVAPALLQNATLSEPFTDPAPKTFTVDDVNEVITSAEAIAAGINGTVTANLLAQSGANGTLPSNANVTAVVDQALQDKGVVATRQQIATRLTAAMLSPAYQKWLKQQPADANQGALGTLQLFNQTAATTVDNHNQLNATLSPKSQQGLRGSINSTSPGDAAANVDSRDKAAAGLATAQIAIGGLRYVNSALGKAVNIQKLIDKLPAEQLKKVGTLIANSIQKAQSQQTGVNVFSTPEGVETSLENDPQFKYLTKSAQDVATKLMQLMSERGWFNNLSTGLSAASTVLAASSFGVRAARLSGMTDPVNQASTGISLVADMMSIADSAISLYGKLSKNWRKAIGGAAAYIGTPATWLMAKAGLGSASDIPGAQFLGSLLENGGDVSNLLYAGAVFGSLRNFATEGFNYRDTYNTIRSVVDASSFALWAANKAGAVSDMRMNQIRFGTTGLSALLAFIAAGNP